MKLGKIIRYDCRTKPLKDTCLSFSYLVTIGKEKEEQSISHWSENVPLCVPQTSFSSVRDSIALWLPLNQTWMYSLALPLFPPVCWLTSDGCGWGRQALPSHDSYIEIGLAWKAHGKRHFRAKRHFSPFFLRWWNTVVRNVSLGWPGSDHYSHRSGH